MLKSGKLHSWCIDCFGAYTRARRAENVEQARAREAAYRLSRREYFAAKQREWTAKNKDKVRIINRTQHLRPGEKEKRLAYNAQYTKEKLARSPEFWIEQKVKRAFQRNLKLRVNREDRVRLTGCSMRFLKEWLEAQFQSGMTWENRGSVWHIDHKRPITSFDFSNPKDVHDCYHYSNLQPLFALDNLRKGGRYLPA